MVRYHYVGGDHSYDTLSADEATINEASLDLGENADASGTDSVALGADANAGGDTSTVVGDSATDNDVSNGVTIGQSASGWTGVAVGKNSTVQGGNAGSVAIGNGASATQNGAIAIGDTATGGPGSISIGDGPTVSTGSLAKIHANQLVFGGVRDTVADADLDNNNLLIELDETNSAFRLRGKDSSGTVREATIAW